MSMKRTQLYIDDELYQKLASEASKERRTISSLIRELLAKEINIKSMQKTTKGSNLLVRLTHFAAEGPVDLSTRGEDYFIKDFKS